MNRLDPHSLVANIDEGQRVILREHADSVTLTQEQVIDGEFAPVDVMSFPKKAVHELVAAFYTMSCEIKDRA